MLKGIVDELYDQFVSVVDEGRPGLDRAQVTALATGAIYTARQARDSGLVDELGDQETVVAWFAQQLGGDVEVVESRRRAGLTDLLFGAHLTPPTAERALGSLLESSTGPRFLYFWEGGR